MLKSYRHHLPRRIRSGQSLRTVNRRLYKAGRPLLTGLILILTLVGCTAKPDPHDIDLPEERVTTNDEFQLTDPTSPTPTVIVFPDELVLGVESRWMSSSKIALASMNQESLPASVQLLPVDPSLELIKSGMVDLLLVPDADGIPVADRAMALAVPWASEWEHVSLREADALLEEDSPFVVPLEWSEITPAMKPLKIDGLHPSQPDYPLRTTWSLHARSGLEVLAQAIAEALSIHLADEPVKLTAVGDIMLARGLGDRIRTGEEAFPFSAVEHLWMDADLTIGNLESALGEGGHAENKGYTFLAPARAASALGQAGFDVLSLANNHAMDYGPQTLLQAIELLDQQNIRTVGAGENSLQAYAPLEQERANFSIAILAFVDVPVEVRGFDTRTWEAQETRTGIAWADPDQMRNAIKRAREFADLIIVLLHSGYEYIKAPSPPQQAAARLAIDAGADLVIGHHSHVLQGVEFYASGVIIYGLGNFAFEDGGVVESGLMNIWVDSDGIRSLEFLPLHVGLDGRPFPPDPVSAESIRKDFYNLTRNVDP